MSEENKAEMKRSYACCGSNPTTTPQDDETKTAAEEETRGKIRYTYAQLAKETTPLVETKLPNLRITPTIQQKNFKATPKELISA